MMASYISKGQMTWDDMSADQKAQAAKYEAIMGMPIGFMSKLQMEAGANIISSTQRVAPNGYTYIDMVYQDKNGATKVKSIRTGKTRIASSGGSSSSSSQNKLFAEASKLLEDYEATLQREIYRDGTDNEQMADKLMADWEIDRAIGRFKEVYGDKLGMELFNYAWTMGGYEEWTK
jgi:ribosome-binding protein aMBF1 (putative translation factor)